MLKPKSTKGKNKMKENFEYKMLVGSLLNAIEYIQEATNLPMHYIEEKILGLEIGTYLALIDDFE